MKKILTPVIVSFILFSCAYHLGAFTLIYNHDSVDRIFQPESFAYTLSLGRPLKWVLDRTINNYGVQSIHVYILTYLTLLMNSILIIEIFSIKSINSKLGIIIINLLFPIFGFYWAYGNDIWQYMIYILFTTLAIYLIQNKKYLHASIFVAFSLLGYQATLSYATSLLVLVLLVEMRFKSYTFSTIFKKFGVIFIGCVLYLLCIIILQMIFSVSMTEYNGGSEIGIYHILVNIPDGIVTSYKKIMFLFIGRHDFFYNQIIGISVFITVVLSASYTLKALPTNDKKVMSLILLLLWPLFLSSTDFAVLQSLPRLDFGLLPLFMYPVVILGDGNDKIFKVTLNIFLILYTVFSLVEINAILKIGIEKNELDFEIIKDIENQVVKGDEIAPIAICGNIYFNDNFTQANEYPYVLNHMWNYRYGPSFYLRNEHPGTESENYYIHFENLFRVNDANLELRSAQCNGNQNQYPEPGYIVQRDDGVFEVYLSRI